MQAIDYANDGIVTEEELKKIGRGDGSLGEEVYENGESQYVFETDYGAMGISSNSLTAFKPALRTNSTDKSIFYIRLNYFE